MVKKHDSQYNYWGNAGKIGYGNTYYKNRGVEKYSLSVVWQATMQATRKLGLGRSSDVLELGCGDGAFVNQVLSKHVRNIIAFDYAPSAVMTARANFRSGNIRFAVRDVTKLNFPRNARYDGVFMLGILHHVKKSAPEIIAKVSNIAPVVIVGEPNGNSIFRKLFEIVIPSYKKAGEQSIPSEELHRMFGKAGFELVFSKYILMVPWFTPVFLLPLMIKLEKFIQKFRFPDFFNSTVVLGYKKRKMDN